LPPYKKSGKEQFAILFKLCQLRRFTKKSDVVILRGECDFGRNVLHPHDENYRRFEAIA
jgi:hypothetical protein